MLTYGVDSKGNVRPGDSEVLQTSNYASVMSDVRVWLKIICMRSNVFVAGGRGVRFTIRHGCFFQKFLGIFGLMQEQAL